MESGASSLGSGFRAPQAYRVNGGIDVSGRHAAPPATKSPKHLSEGEAIERGGNEK